jgi:hypothetical protein
MESTVGRTKQTAWMFGATNKTVMKIKEHPELSSWTAIKLELHINVA